MQSQISSKRENSRKSRHVFRIRQFCGFAHGTFEMRYSDPFQYAHFLSLLRVFAALADHLALLTRNCTGLEADQAQIDRKQTDLNRAQKRLETIKKFK
jgi:hypothetical protein